MIGHVAASGIEEIANDIACNPYYREMDALPQTRSEATLPLMINKRVLGVLDVQSNQLNAFDEMDMLVLHALADHLAIAIENAQLFDVEHRRVAETIQG